MQRRIEIDLSDQCNAMPGVGLKNEKWNADTETSFC